MSYWVIVIMSALASVSCAESFYEVAPGPSENHLHPVDPMLSEYDKRLTEHLFVDDGRFGRLLARPSFTPEVCLSIHATVSSNDLQKYQSEWNVPDAERIYWATVTVPKESIYHSMAENNDKKMTRKVEVDRFDRQISLQLAVLIQRVWGKMLHNTRYPAKSDMGCDGTDYQFSVWVRGMGDLHGETWSPQGGLPHELVEIGNSLIEFVQAKPPHANNSEAMLADRLRQLEKKIDSAEPPVGGDEKPAPQP